MLRNFLIISMLVSISMLNATAQTTTQVNQDPKTGIRVTTKVTPLPTDEEQLQELERRLAEARQNPDRVTDGTVHKYELAIEQKRAEIAAKKREE